jgi:cytochrome c peroxidase
VQEDTSYFEITKKDVKLNFPKNFPKPFYTFENNKVTPERFLLGRSLFYDEILSKDNTVSCASCHQRIAAFAHIDHTLSHGIYGRIGNRNIPSLQNLIWNNSFMWDGGINHLEVQPIGPITNKLEMDETIEGCISKLKKSEKYISLFQKAYGDSIINSERMLKSLTQFMGLMISNKSKYDKYLAKKVEFTPEENHGLQLFKSKCASCHTEPLFTNNLFLNNGLLPDSSLHDMGRSAITQNQDDKYKYRVPTVRNIEMTYPYMHDGRFKKLKEVINYYGTPENFTVNSDPLLKKIGVLDFNEKRDLILFLLTLTDKEFLYDRRFVDPNFETQKSQPIRQ